MLAKMSEKIIDAGRFASTHVVICKVYLHLLVSRVDMHLEQKTQIPMCSTHVDQFSRVKISASTAAEPELPKAESQC
jgi:hypothetical protein